MISNFHNWVPHRVSGKKDQKEIYFTFTNYRIAPAIFSLDPESGEVTLYRASKSPFDGNRYKTEQVFYTSKDGTRIPMIITYGKDTVLNGSTPTILYAYGGFNISIRPRFSSTVAAWLEMGGMYAVPNIRGGGEYGKAWHIAGTKLQKQNVFDDFIAAAEFLIDEGYTSKERLAVSGRSNGGLLVGAVTTQRPDLFQVSLPGVACSTCCAITPSLQARAGPMTTARRMKVRKCSNTYSVIRPFITPSLAPPTPPP